MLESNEIVELRKGLVRQREEIRKASEIDAMLYLQDLNRIEKLVDQRLRTRSYVMQDDGNKVALSFECCLNSKESRATGKLLDWWRAYQHIIFGTLSTKAGCLKIQETSRNNFEITLEAVVPGGLDV